MLKFSSEMATSRHPFIECTCLKALACVNSKLFVASNKCKIGGTTFSNTHAYSTTPPARRAWEIHSIKVNTTLKF